VGVKAGRAPRASQVLCKRLAPVGAAVALTLLGTELATGQAASATRLDVQSRLSFAVSRLGALR